MKNKIFIDKALELKPKLSETTKILKSARLLKENDEIIFDFGNHYVGYITLDLDYEGNHQDCPVFLQLNFAEIKEELNYNAEEYKGWISKSWIQEERIHIDVLPCRYKLERRYAFRYLKIKVIGLNNNFNIKFQKITLKAVSSANQKKLRNIKMSDKDKKLDDVSLRTLHNCMQEVFEDGPKRDRRLWLGDLRLQALANYQTYKNYDLVKRCLYMFAGSTLKNGLLSSNIFTYPEIECDFQSMFDYTLFFINVLRDYYEQTKDIKTLKELEPTCLKQYKLLSKCFDTNNLLDLNKTERVFIDWNFELDKKCAGQAVYIYALKDLVKIEKVLKKDTKKVEKEIALKSKALLDNYYDSELNMFRSDKQYSYASQIWVILAGVVDNNKGLEIINNIEKYDKAIQINSPYLYHHYIQALIDLGEKKKAYKKMHEYWGGMIKAKADTFWELYNPDNLFYSPYGGIVVHSFCHAWSCTPTYFLRKYYY